MSNIPEKWQSLKSTEAWKQFRQLQDTAVETLLAEADNELEVLDAYKLVMRTIAVASEVVLDPHGDCPAFIRMDTPARNVGGDNPDGEYDVTVIDGRKRYRVYGNRGQIAYFGFQVLGGTGMEPRRHLAYMSDKDLETDDKGNFEFILSVEDPGNGRQWLPIGEDASAIVVRHYIGNRALETLPDLNIEVLDKSADYTAPTDQEVADKITATAWTMLKLSLLYRDINTKLSTPNRMETFSSEQAGAADTTPDNTYMLGLYDVQPGQALVIDVTPPDTRYWNLTIYNYWHECIDYMHRPHSMTNQHVNTRPDGTVRFVLSGIRPNGLTGDDNWLSTSSRTRGVMVLRWLDTPPEVSLPNFKLVDIADSGALVGVD